MPLALDAVLTYIKGVGPARAAMLQSRGLETVEDLLHYFPFRYEDRSNLKPIKQLAPGELATVIGEVKSSKLSGFRRRNLGLFEATFTDASGGTLLAKWFHGAYLADRLTVGTRVALFGKIEFDNYRGEIQMMHPETELLSGEDDEGDSGLHTGRIVPVYEAARQSQHPHSPHHHLSRSGADAGSGRLPSSASLHETEVPQPHRSGAHRALPSPRHADSNSE